jgi:transcriptional regulator with XRE-family HTH domain
MSDEMTFGQWLRRYREVRHLSLQEMGRHLRYSEPYLSDVEQTSRLGIQLARVIFELLPLSPEERHTLQLICRAVLLPMEQDRLFQMGSMIVVRAETEPVAPPKRASSRSDMCFVIMPFAEPINSYYKPIIIRAIAQARMKAVRADDSVISGAIFQQIWDGINDAVVCVADLTGQNCNVMYELGLAHALRKPVVAIIQDTKDIPFDLRHIRHIVYDTKIVGWDRQLRARLKASLLATIDDPQEAIAFRDR